MPCQKLAVPSPGRPWPKPNIVGAGPGLCPGHSGQAQSRDFLLFKATAGFSYKMADGYVGHFVTPLEDKEPWKSEGRTSGCLAEKRKNNLNGNKALPCAEA